ncbi:DUF4136 domain-containing protein [Thalassotalea sp. ND16A]|uniref:DUF4136 domain-containing protein n=1 Tax=Thalassotalea sp. ND16A TaxID=1535422 RepID=UPI00051A1BBD|nr:DUF4136 domain-containing protein [Thalassotalea sp. ND16A]KGJ98534.1 hypothetical protein ND16A_0604 [Thalassotalea sp. ND16A]
MHKVRLINFIAFIIGSSLLLTACKSTDTNVDYDTDTNFSTFSDYQFVASNEAQAAPMEQLTSDRIKDAVMMQLTAKSLNMADTDAQLQVSYFTTREEREDTSSFSIGIGGVNRSSSSATGIGVGTTIPLDSGINIYTQITIDIHHQGKLIWRGFDGFEAEQGIKAAEKHQEINKVVGTILSNFPPKQ